MRETSSLLLPRVSVNKDEGRGGEPGLGLGAVGLFPPPSSLCYSGNLTALGTLQPGLDFILAVTKCYDHT